MANMRIREFAKNIGKTNKEVLAELKKLGIEGKTHSSNISEDISKKLEKIFKKETVMPAPSEAQARGEKKEPAKGKIEKKDKPRPSLDLKIPPKKHVEKRHLETVVEGEVEEEISIPERFKKSLDTESIEKIRPNISMQRAFQSIRKIEQRKTFDMRYGKKTGRFKLHARPSIQKKHTPITAPRKKVIKLQEGTTVKELAEIIGQKVSDIIKKFMDIGVILTINQPVDMDAAILISDSYGIKIEPATVETIDIVDKPEDESTMLSRSPVVTIMGHVDHGKTSLLDVIRETKVTESEAGGITQRIGAYKVTLGGKEIVFLDTPGHEAFTAMRSRGAKVTDIVVLVVAADDGVKPQTIEAIDHAKAANVPIVVAINKIDKDEADIARVKNELTEYGVIPEEWGGKNIFIEVSAKKRIGIENLLEMILLQAEMMELKANPDKQARGTIIESKMDKGRGPIATILILSGSLNVSDVFLSGVNYGRVRALTNDTGNKIDKVGPATPVEVVGFSDVPNAGDPFAVVDDEKTARQISFARKQQEMTAQRAHPKKLSLDELYEKIKEGEIKELNIIIKADVHGSVEAIRDTIEGIKHEKVKVKIIHAAVGGINDSDVILASASNAIIIGFNVRGDTKAMKTAEREGVDIKFYNVIYEAIEDVKKALEGLLEPTLKEKILGTAEVRQLFQVSRIGTIAGCYVTDGSIMRTSDGIRVIRNNVVVYDGKISTLKRFKDDVKEVQSGYECGILIENYNDIKVGDILENYIIEKTAAKL